MNVESILKKITNNWFAKCVCIASAIILYLFGLTSRLEKRTFSIPLTVIEEGSLVKTSSLQPTVSVTVRSDSKNIPNITSSDIKATLDLSYFAEEGVYNVPVMLNLSTEIVLADPVELIVKPETILVKLEEKVRKSVPIKVPTVGDPVHGYEISSIKTEPTHAIITGPRSIIDKISSIKSDDVVIAEQKENFSITQKLRSFNKHIKIDEPAQVVANIQFQQSLVEKKFYNYSVYANNLKPGFEVLTDEKVSFTINGAELVLEKFYPSAQAVQIDCSSITAPGEYELPLVILVPDSVKIVESNIQNVKILVKEKKVEENRDTKIENSAEKNIPTENENPVEVENESENVQLNIQQENKNLQENVE